LGYYPGKSRAKDNGHQGSGFFGAAMAPMEELEYTGVVDRIKELDKKFSIRNRNISIINHFIKNFTSNPAR